MKQHNSKLALLLAGCALLTVGLSAPLASSSPLATSKQICDSSQMSQRQIYDRMIDLANALDSTQKLSKLISETQPRPKVTNSGDGDPLDVAVSEPEPVKRSPDEEAAPASNVTATTPSALEAIKAMVTASSEAPKTAPTTAPTATPAPVTSAAVKSDQAASSPAPTASQAGNATTPAPKVAETTAASNVTVNVFLQLAPDAKTDELVSVETRSYI